MLLKKKEIANKKKKSLGIYVHIPFCRSKCEYCDFYSLGGARNKELMDRYLGAVLAHIREAAPSAIGYEVDTVYFGSLAGFRNFERAVTDEEIAHIQGFVEQELAMRNI